MIRNWIYEDNLKPFLISLSWIVEYAFDPDEWTAIRFGIEETNDEDDVWYEYEFAGKNLAQLRIARDSGSCVVHFRVDVRDSLSREVDLAIRIFAMFHSKMESKSDQTC